MLNGDSPSVYGAKSAPVTAASAALSKCNEKSQVLQLVATGTVSIEQALKRIEELTPKAHGGRISFKVSEKGALSVYGLQRMPVTLYVEQWERLSAAMWGNPNANRLTIHILAAVAEDEARRISERTRAALAAAKQRGVKLGAARPECRNLTDEARRRGIVAGAAAVKERTDAAYEAIATILEQMRAARASYLDMAALLNAAGHTTSRGTPWTASTVLKVGRRLGLFDEGHDTLDGCSAGK